MPHVIRLTIIYGACAPVKVTYRRVAPDRIESDIGSSLTGDPVDMDAFMKNNPSEKETPCLPVLPI